MRIGLLALAMGIMLNSHVGSAAELKLGQGTKSLSGALSITVNPVEDVHRLLLAPSFSYFAAENIELALGARFQTDIGLETTSYFGGHLGVFGYWGMGGLFLKSGASIGFVSYLGSDGVVVLEFAVPVLLVVALSDSVALHCGTSIEMQFRPGGGANLLIPIGLLGVQTFF